MHSPRREVESKLKKRVRNDYPDGAQKRLHFKGVKQSSHEHQNDAPKFQLAGRTKYGKINNEQQQGQQGVDIGRSIDSFDLLIPVISLGYQLPILI